VAIQAALKDCQTPRSLAKKFGVSHFPIYRIKKKEGWNHVEAEV
jgi:hypothetical protein